MYENVLRKYNFTMKNCSDDDTPALPQLLLPIYPCIYVVASNTTSHLISQAISSTRGAISSINAHHTRLVKLFSFNLVCAKIILREYFFDENLLDEIKAN